MTSSNFRRNCNASGVEKLLLISAIIVITVAAGCDRSGSENEQRNGESEDSLQVFWKRAFEMTGGIRVRPRIVGDSIVLFSGGAHLRAFRVANGSTKWKTSLEPETELYSRRLLVSKGTVCSPHQGQVLSWDLETGRQQWKFVPPEGNRLFEIGFYDLGPEHFYGSGSGKLLIINREDGSLSREEEYGGASTLYQDGSLFLGQAWTPEGAEGQSRGGILKVNVASGDSLWFFKTERGGFYRMRPLLDEGRVYAGTRGGEMTEFVALDAETGEVIWRNKEARVYAAEMAAGKIFVNTGRDVMALDKETGETLWHAGLEAGHGESELAYLDGYVYHPHGQGLRVISAKTGEVVHIEWPENGYFWEVSTGAGKVFAQDSGALYAFEPYSPE